MTPLLRSSALALACLAVGAAAVAQPASADAGHDDRGAGTAAHATDLKSLAAAARPAHADRSVTRRALDGTPYVMDQWAAPADESSADDQGDEVLTASQAEAVTGAALADTFTLHSKPDSTHTIYLDFDGGSLISTNSWLLNGLSSLLFPGWSIDSSPSFSSTERAIIQEVWARVAEDYAPFDVDVTTEAPADGALWRSSKSDTTYGTRVVFTSGTRVQTGVCGGPCGGIAWIGVFNAISKGETRSPAWVFPVSLGNRAKTMAEAASHEAGHNLGLTHDGTTSESYYSGTSLWGPIMGSPYNAAVSQWSRGSYPSANNKQDDNATLVDGGIPLRTDEAGDTVATAAPLTSLPDHRGYITRGTDVDMYSVDQCSGQVTVHASGAPVGPNLDIGLDVRTADGRVLASAAPPTERTANGVTGMDAAVTLPLNGGPFYISVRGTGSGKLWTAGGYDSYGSIGSYTLYANGCLGSPATPPPGIGGAGSSSARPSRPARPRVASGPRGGARTLKVAWSPAVSRSGPITGYRLDAYRLGRGGRVVAVRSKVVSPRARTARLVLSTGRWSVQVRARNQAGWSAPSVRSVGVRAR